MNVTAISKVVDSLGGDVDNLFMLICAFMVFSMQAGFALVEAGSIVANLRSILMKNVLDICLCTLSWWLIGYGLARGRFQSSFISVEIPFHLPPNMIPWFFDLSFVATSATIVSGAMAERTKFICYAAFTLVISGVIYPFVCHWVWADSGFMAAANPAAPVPLLDFAGCGVVHMVGGFSGITGAYIVGPRPGIWVQKVNMLTKKDWAVRDRLLATQKLWQVIGVIMLWVGWYGFNCGSVASIVGKSPVVGRVAINTTVAAIVGALTASIVCYFHVGIFVIDKVLMGILAGLVSVTAGAPYFWAPAAAAIGFVGFFVYYVVDLALVKFEIDDPVSAFPVHGCCGLWGLIAVGFFQIPALRAVIIILWSLITSTATFLFLRWALHGTIRMVNAEHEFRLDEEEYPRVGPKGRVTMLFTDIQSSTSLWEADEDTMAECLIMHDNILRLKLKAHNGFEVKTEGDAFMSAFGSCQDALQYCIAVQLELLQQKWPKAIYSNFFARVQEDNHGRIIWKGLRVRMGFHTGEPSDKENPVTTRTDYFGRDVNYAARVSSMGTGGQILISSASVQDLLPHYSDVTNPLGKVPPFGMEYGRRYDFAELKCFLTYIGRFSLKGISHSDEGEHLYQVDPYGLETRQFGPLRTDSAEVYSPAGGPAAPFPDSPKPSTTRSGKDKYQADDVPVDVRGGFGHTVNRLSISLPPPCEELEMVEMLEEVHSPNGGASLL